MVVSNKTAEGVVGKVVELNILDCIEVDKVLQDLKPRIKVVEDIKKFHELNPDYDNSADKDKAYMFDRYASSNGYKGANDLAEQYENRYKDMDDSVMKLVKFLEKLTIPATEKATIFD